MAWVKVWVPSSKKKRARKRKGVGYTRRKRTPDIDLIIGRMIRKGVPKKLIAKKKADFKKRYPEYFQPSPGRLAHLKRMKKG